MPNHLGYPVEEEKSHASLPKSPWVVKIATPYKKSAPHSLLLAPLGVELYSSLVVELHPFPIGWVD
jgi:hypothetical protein